MADSLKKIGKVTHYYDKIGVAIVKLDQEVKIGDFLQFKGKKTEFRQTLVEMQIEHQPIQKAAANQEVGIKVEQEVKEGDEVFLVE